MYSICRFTNEHGFEKPHDEQGLHLMNTAALVRCELCVRVLLGAVRDSPSVCFKRHQISVRTYDVKYNVTIFLCREW